MTKEVDFIKAFDIIADDVHQTAKDKGWWDVQTAEEWLENDYPTGSETTHQFDIRTFKAGQQNPEPNKAEKLALIHSEISEALEGIRKPGPDKHCPEFTNEEIELADAIIRIMDYAKYFDLRLPEALIAKLQYNKTREHKHGGKKF